MVKMLAAKPYQAQIPLIYNVEGAVGGQPALNNPDDVILVKAFLRKVGEVPKPNMDAGTIALLKGLQINATPDQSLINAIKAYQSYLKIADPKLSSMAASARPRKGSHTWAGLRGRSFSSIST
jgi:hypothetical protein